jgi:hypothetical protein
MFYRVNTWSFPELVRVFIHICEQHVVICKTRTIFRGFEIPHHGSQPRGQTPRSLKSYTTGNLLLRTNSEIVYFQQVWSNCDQLPIEIEW